MVNDVVVPQFPLQNDEDLLDWKPKLNSQDSSLGLTPVSGVKPHPVRLLVIFTALPKTQGMENQTCT